MQRYIAKRVLLLIPILLGVTFIVFSIMALTPGDPARLILGQGAPKEAVDKLSNELGFNKPLIVRYVNYLTDAVKGDFGKSYRTGRPVFEAIMERFPVTLKLSVLGVCFVILVGLPIGIISAVRQYSAMDVISTVSAMLMASIPGFWLGLMLILLFSLKLGWLPSSGVESLKSFIMPTITLALPSTAEIIRMTRSTMLETIRQDYIRTARSKGANKTIIIWRHALKNALLPVVTVLGSNFGALLGGAVLIETVFSLPGLGILVVNSIRSKDIPQVMAATLFIAFIFCIILMLVDIIYAYIDPRIKAMYEK